MFDLIVIGSGSAASSIASRCRAAGWSVAMIDKRPFGGTCALRGCDPKKVLVAAAAAVDAARALAHRGVRPDGLALDWPAVMRFKRTFTDPVAATRRAALARSGIETFDGIARFVGPARLSVNDDTLEAARAIAIATGAVPAPLPIAGAEHVTISDDFLELESLPSSIAFIGGGYVSFEFAHVAARAGARVTMLHRGPRPLEQFDRDLVDRLAARTRALDIDLRLATEVRRVEPVNGRLRVAGSAESGEVVVEADLVVHGAGRVPDLQELDLDAGGVKYSRDGITVNEYLQSVSNPKVYAAGDCADSKGPPLTPVASYEGRVVAANLLEGNHTRAEYVAVPSVVFTIPPLARAGVDEDEARRQQLRFTVRYEETAEWHSSRRVGEQHSAFKVFVEDGTDRILGAHLLGPHADETINLFALAMRAGIPARQLRQMLWAYPTQASDIAYMLPASQV
ncbi:MAG TPA: NAD(P)/FAD-dependent oxidoreductase [Vicinamibacterales bacterium]